jgi:APA family basic amino acid/polyamine antiporter
MSHSIFRTKPLTLLMADASEASHSLRKTLGAWDLVAIGIGCIIGVGIFVLPGVEAATHAGPGIILSFGVAALACACSALCYAELAAMIPVAGSAYTYGYATLGEILGWIIGWDLILEYMVGASLVAIGWSAYLVNLLNHALAKSGAAIPHALVAAPWGQSPGVVNLPAAAIVLFLTWLLVRGIKESARVNLVIVIVKVAVILTFVLLAVWYVNPTNWTPFLPFGFKGVATAAAIVFLAYVGFDAVSTTAEEAVNPQRDLPIGIIGSLIVATALYMAVAAIMTGIVPYQQLNVADPVALVLNVLEMPWASMLISLGAICGITSVLLVLLLGQPRILFAMSRDGLLPRALSHVHPRFRTPHVTTILTGCIVATAAALTPINVVAELCSIGTLFAFIIVCAGVIVLRFTRADVHRPYSVPGGWGAAAFVFVPFAAGAALAPLPVWGRVLLWAAGLAACAAFRKHVLPASGILLCGYLMLSLPVITWLRLVTWLFLGLALYAAYGYKHSAVATAAAGASAPVASRPASLRGVLVVVFLAAAVASGFLMWLLPHEIAATAVSSFVAQALGWNF